VKRVVAAVFVSLMGIAAAAWAPSGCATRQAAAPQPDPRNARNYEPDGGWANYRPTGNDVARQRDVGPNGPMSGTVPVVPTPGMSTVDRNVH
jgi:hypothetical protein